MTNDEWLLFSKKFQKVVEYFGSIKELASFLNVTPANLYTIRAKKNFKDGKLIRNIPLAQVLKIEKKMKTITRADLRPDLYN